MTIRAGSRDGCRFAGQGGQSRGHRIEFKIPQCGGLQGAKPVGRTIDVTRRARLTAGLRRATCLSTPGSRLTLAILVAAGTLSTAFPASAKDHIVTDEATLHDAIKDAQKDDTITFTADI